MTLTRSSMLFLAALVTQAFSPAAQADTFGSGANLFDIDFVTIGDVGNLPDTTGDPNPAGAVAYEYRIGKYEISEQMINKANAQSTLDAQSDPEIQPLGITIDNRGPDKPATRASWFEAAQFVNWLNTSSGSSPAYKFNGSGVFELWTPGDTGYDPTNAFRNTQAQYFLPSADEWYKAAFYDPVSDTWFDFPNGSNTAPIPVASGTAPNTAVYDQPFFGGIPGDSEPAEIQLAGGESPFGTVAQAGNVLEWEETEFDLINDVASDSRGLRGGAWLDLSASLSLLSSVDRFSSFIPPSNEFGDLGFRIASIAIPEPNTIWLMLVGSIGALLQSRALRTFDIA